jgi:hypothetical protein
VYHTGSMMHEIEKGDQKLKQLQSSVFDAHERGECMLFQKRLAPFQYEYRAVKIRPRPATPQSPRRTEKKVRSTALPAQMIIG